MDPSKPGSKRRERRPALQPLVSVERLDRLGPWYHSFDSLGVRVPHRDDSLKAGNQRAKEGPIFAYLQLAIEKSRAHGGGDPSVLELFCADGYYAAHARRMGAGIVHGVDLNPSHVERANAVFSVLYDEHDVFHVRDVHELQAERRYDVVLCCGGLYHTPKPEAVLRSCRKWTRRFLVVQTVVNPDHADDPQYIQSPPEGRRPHGSSFSAAYLDRALALSGWEVIDRHSTGIGSGAQIDRESVFALCRPPEKRGKKEPAPKP